MLLRQIHGAEKSYVCAFCSKTFTAAMLRIHAKITCVIYNLRLINTVDGAPPLLPRSDDPGDWPCCWSFQLQQVFIWYLQLQEVFSWYFQLQQVFSWYLQLQQVFSWYFQLGSKSSVGPSSFSKSSVGTSSL